MSVNGELKEVGRWGGGEVGSILLVSFWDLGITFFDYPD